MKVNANTATAKDYDIAAQKNANAFWFWLIISGIVYYYLIWLAIIPVLFTIFEVIASIGATRAATKLRKGTFKIPNPNNGAPDGDIRNLK